MTVEEYKNLTSSDMLVALADDPVNGITKDKAYRVQQVLAENSPFGFINDNREVMLVQHHYLLFAVSKNAPAEAVSPSDGVQVALKRLWDDMEYLRNPDASHWNIRQDDGARLMALGEQLTHSAAIVFSQIKGYVQSALAVLNRVPANVGQIGFN